jgi:hypothetical protein
MHCKFCGAPAFKDICPRHENEALFGKARVDSASGSKVMEIISTLRQKTSGLVSDTEWNALIAAIAADVSAAPARMAAVPAPAATAVVAVVDGLTVEEASIPVPVVPVVTGSE